MHSVHSFVSNYCLVSSNFPWIIEWRSFGLMKKELIIVSCSFHLFLYCSKVWSWCVILCQFTKCSVQITHLFTLLRMKPQTLFSGHKAQNWPIDLNIHLKLERDINWITTLTYYSEHLKDFFLNIPSNKEIFTRKMQLHRKRRWKGWIPLLKGSFHKFSIVEDRSRDRAFCSILSTDRNDKKGSDMETNEKLKHRFL